MSSFAMIKLQVRALELRLGVKRGGFGFWLFVFNCLASLSIFVSFAFWLHIVFGFVAIVVAAWFIVFVNVTGFWNGLGGLKNG